jgi:NAD-dependent deacetylase
MMISKELRDYIQKSFKRGHVICLSGAGISYESGIPTFRGQGGLWEKYDPALYAHLEGLTQLFKTNPIKVIDFIIDFYSVILKAYPNPAHRALAILEKENILTSTITQNIDGLHQEAGSRNVIELHGNAFRIRCNCAPDKTRVLAKDEIKEMIGLLKNHKNSRIKILRVLSRYFPRCLNCGCRYRIDIVLFGEMLPQDELSRAYKELNNCHVLLIIGSSLVVYPAAGLPLYAKVRGAQLIEINNEPSGLSDLCDYRILGQAGEILTEILGVLGYA